MRVLGQLWARVRNARPRTILLVAWLLFVVYAYPGQMTQDAYDHLAEARAGFYTDGHPPIIAHLWWLLEFVIEGPFGMLVVQSVGFLLGLYFVLARTFTAQRAAWIAMAILFYPPVLTPLGVIWKDCLMAAALLLGLAGLLSARPRWGLVGMFFATAFRYNAIGATLPLVVLLFEAKPGLAGFRRYALALAVWFGVTLAAFGVNRVLTDRQMHYWASSLAPFDIVGTLAHVHPDLSDAEVEKLVAGTEILQHDHLHERMRALYTTETLNTIKFGDNRLWDMPVTGTTPAPAPKRNAMARAWRETVTRWPGAWLTHRFAVMGDILCLTRSKPSGAVLKRVFLWPERDHAIGLSTRWSPVQLRLIHLPSWVLRHTPLFRPWIYLAVALILLGIARRHRDVLALLLSGILMEGTLLPLAPSTDYRYSHWMIVATVIAVVVLIKRRAAPPPAPSTP